MRLTKSRSSITHINSFFVEIIIVILFFSISSAIIVQVFAEAFSKNEQATKLNNAILIAESVANVFSENASLEETINELYGKSGLAYVDDLKTAKIPLGADWTLSTTDLMFSIVVNIKTENTIAGKLSIAHIYITEGNKILFSLKSSCYTSAKGVNYEN